MKPHGLLLVLGLTATAAAADAVPIQPPPAGAWAKLPLHPRLFADAARWAAIKKSSEIDPVAKKLAALIRERAERVLKEPPVAFVDRGAFLHGPMRQVQGRILTLAAAYRLTADPRFLARARRELADLTALPDWYPKHFLDTGEAALAAAVGLDWLHDDLPADERDRVAAAIVGKALRVFLDNLGDRSLTAWAAGRNNWNPVCHGGLAAAALAVADREPDLARRVVDRAVAGVRPYAAEYAPAGAYPEGPGYWAYGTTFYVLLADALRTALGTTCGLEQAPGFLKTADYTAHLTGPTGVTFNFSDSTSEFAFEPVRFWFARELRRGDIARPELDALDARRVYLTSDATRDDAGRMLALALVWWNPDLGADHKPAPARPLVWWSEGGGQPQAVMRSAWDDPRAVFVGFKGGTPNDSHAHMDVGSFVFDADGVRWAVDLGRDSYPKARQNGVGSELFSYAQASKRWDIFRVGPDGHNIIRFDGAKQVVTGKADIAPAARRDATPGFVVDLGPVYAGQVASARRGFQLLPDRRLAIRDEWTAAGHDTQVSWQWLTHADVTPLPNGAVLRHADKTLRLRLLTPADAALAVEDVSKPANPFDSPNPGLKRIVVRMKTPAGKSGQLVVLAEPGATAASPATPVVIDPLSAW